jgi:hypothetical protein
MAKNRHTNQFFQKQQNNLLPRLFCCLSSASLPQAAQLGRLHCYFRGRCFGRDANSKLAAPSNPERAAIISVISTCQNPKGRCRKMLYFFEQRLWAWRKVAAHNALPSKCAASFTPKSINLFVSMIDGKSSLCRY